MGTGAFDASNLEKQEDIWIAHTELASAPGHPFYQRLNELLEAEKFDVVQV